MKRFTVEITDLQWQTLADIVVDPRAWVTGAVMGKIHSCEARVVEKEQRRLLEDPDTLTIPATVAGILESHFAQADYKTRAERLTAEEEAMEASINISGSSGA